MKLSNKSKIESLNEEFKSIVLKKPEFENRDESIFFQNFVRFWTTTHLKHEREFFIQYYMKSKIFPFAILVERIKAVVTEI